MHSIAGQQDKPAPAVSPDLIASLTQCSFPGNVRELYNLVHHAVTCNDGRPLSIADFAGIKQAPTRALPAVDAANPLMSMFGKFPTILQVEEYLIGEAMKLTGGNQTTAAELLGVTRPTLNKRLKQERQSGGQGAGRHRQARCRPASPGCCRAKSLAGTLTSRGGVGEVLLQELL